MARRPAGRSPSRILQQRGAHHGGDNRPVPGGAVAARNSFDEAITAHRVQRPSRLLTQLIIREETHITNVVDPWAGSYMMESLTRKWPTRPGPSSKRSRPWAA
ncbi:MAG: methylmalonyl-CoA mutase family protein [Burkholderiaceae bacterium]